MARRTRQSPPSLLVIIVICLIIAVLLYRNMQRTRTHTPEIHCGEHCGTERWQIKTASDAEAASINPAPQSSSIAELASLPAPRESGDTRSEAETHIYSVEAILLGWKAETGEHGDRDYHLVLADPDDPNRTMIAEVPSGDCANACSSSHLQQFLQTRQILLSHFPEPHAQFRYFTPAWRVRVEGMGFFDMFHRQKGVAENCIELHPVVKIEFLRELEPQESPPHRTSESGEHHCTHIERSSGSEDE